MERIGSGRLDCTFRRRWAPLWIVAAATVLMSLAPARILAQDEENPEGPTPMATPEMMMMLPNVAIFPYPGYGTAPLVVGYAGPLKNDWEPSAFL